MGLFSKAPVIVRDHWNGYAYRFGEGERCIVSFDESACEPAAQTPSQLRRVIGFSPDGEISPTGMPSPAAFARLKAIEDALLEGLTKQKVKCWLIGKQVYRGFRELLFQVDDLAGFAKVYAAVEAKLGGTKLVEHEDWTFFNDKISPGLRGRNHIGNREVIARLKEVGSRLELPHSLDHTFLGPPEALAAIAAELSERGFARPSRHDRSLTMSCEDPLDDQDEIDELTMALHGIAREHGAVYDGWGCAVVS